jgi:hypothetical protein
MTMKVATEISEQAVPVGGRTMNCVRLSIESTTAGEFSREQVWLSEDAPGFEVLRELVKNPGVHETALATKLLDFGDDPARKTSVGLEKEEPEKTEQRRVLESLSRAEQALIDGSVIFREINESARELPAEKEKLQALLRRVDEARAQFTRAQENYSAVRGKAPDVAKVDDHLSKIEKVLSTLQKTAESIRAKAP